MGRLVLLVAALVLSWGGIAFGQASQFVCDADAAIATRCRATFDRCHDNAVNNCDSLYKNDPAKLKACKESAAENCKKASHDCLARQRRCPSGERCADGFCVR
jgi:hypothetical protein